MGWPVVRSSILDHEIATDTLVVVMQRVVMKPDGITFSNGITLPKGTYVGVAERATHLDEGLQPSPVFGGIQD